MILEHKTPKVRRVARSYCRRCLAVMLCCVLAFGLTVRTAPRARANAVNETIGLIGTGGGAAATGALATNPIGATVGLLLLVGCGVPIAAGYVGNEDSIFYGTKGYEIGADCWDSLSDFGYEHSAEIIEWMQSAEDFLYGKGGVKPAEKLEVPAYVAEAVRQWANANLNFADGVCTYDQAAIATTDGDYFVLSEVDTSGISNWSSSTVMAPLVHLGTPLKQVAPTWAKAEVGDYEFSYFVGQLTFTQKLTIEAKTSGGVYYTYSFKPNFYGGRLLTNAGGGSIATAVGSGVDASSAIAVVSDYITNRTSIDFLFYDSPSNRIYRAAYDPSYGTDCRIYPRDYLNLADYGDMVLGVPTTLTKTPALDEPVTQPIAVTVPMDIPTTQVGDVTVPVVGALNPEDVLDGSGAGEEDKPRPDVTPWDKLAEWLDSLGKTVTGAIDNAASMADTYTESKAGDQVMEEVMSQPDSLGALAITKFPFSIPWDITKAIKLLAAPPVTPRWEVDFMSPLADNVGGFPGDTTIVIDFSEYEVVGIVTRWTSTVMFIYALASGTKRLLWTA